MRVRGLPGAAALVRVGALGGAAGYVIPPGPIKSHFDEAERRVYEVLKTVSRDETKVLIGRLQDPSDKLGERFDRFGIGRREKLLSYLRSRDRLLPPTMPDGEIRIGPSQERNTGRWLSFKPTKSEFRSKPINQEERPESALEKWQRLKEERKHGRSRRTARVS